MADNVHVHSAITRVLTEVQLASGFDFITQDSSSCSCIVTRTLSFPQFTFFFLPDYQYFVLHSIFFPSFYVFTIDDNGRFSEDGLWTRVRLHVDTVLWAMWGDGGSEDQEWSSLRAVVMILISLGVVHDFSVMGECVLCSVVDKSSKTEQFPSRIVQRKKAVIKLASF